MSTKPVQLTFDFTTTLPVNTAPKVQTFYLIHFEDESGTRYYLRQVGLAKDWSWIKQSEIDGKHNKPYRARSIHKINEIHTKILNNKILPSTYPRYMPVIETINITEE